MAEREDPNAWRQHPDLVAYVTARVAQRARADSDADAAYAPDPNPVTRRSLPPAIHTFSRRPELVAYVTTATADYEPINDDSTNQLMTVFNNLVAAITEGENANITNGHPSLIDNIADQSTVFPPGTGAAPYPTVAARDVMATVMASRHRVAIRSDLGRTKILTYPFITGHFESSVTRSTSHSRNVS